MRELFMINVYYSLISHYRQTGRVLHCQGMTVVTYVRLSETNFLFKWNASFFAVHHIWFWFLTSSDLINAYYNKLLNFQLYGIILFQETGNNFDYLFPSFYHHKKSMFIMVFRTLVAASDLSRRFMR